MLEMCLLWQIPFLVITGVFVFKNILQIHHIKHFSSMIQDLFGAMGIISPVYGSLHTVQGFPT